MSFFQTTAPDQLQLKRFPPSQDKSLRAWSSADAYLLETLSSMEQSHDAPIFIVNDQFGALNCGLAAYPRLNWTDSLTATMALRKNLANQVEPQPASCIELHWQTKGEQLGLTTNSCEVMLPSEPLPIVLMRIPKHLSLLDLQLSLISQLIDSSGILIAGGMSKEIHRSTIEIFDKYFEQVSTSLAQKKARLIFAKRPRSTRTEKQALDWSALGYLPPAPNRDPTIPVSWVGLPGVFSRHTLDPGTRVLLTNLPELEPGRWLDLGCGTGIIGCYLKKHYPKARLVFADESELAVLSARLSYRQNFHNEQATFIQSHHLTSIEGQFDAIFCNPPFHQQNARLTDIAREMIIASARRLKTDGQLFLVANRHLRYQTIMRRYFRSVRPRSKDPKFILWQASEPKI